MVSEQLRDIDIHFGKELNRGLIGLSDYEKRRKTGLDLLDFVLVGGSGEYFYSRSDARRFFHTKAGDIHRDTPDGVFFGARADAFDAYLGYLIEPHDFSYAEGFQKITGFKLRIIPWPEVESVRSFVSKQFNDRYELSYDRGGWQRFHSAYGMTPEQAVEQIRGLERDLVSQVVRVVGARSQPRTNLVEVNEPEYYIGWVSAKRDAYNQVEAEFKVNKNPINRNRFYKGVPPKLLYHEEGAHAVQAQSFADNIDEGIVNRGRGITTIPGSEQWILEAWASEVTRIFPSVLNPLSAEQRSAVQLAVELDYLTNITYNNALYGIQILGENKSKVARDLEELLPHEPADRIELMLTAMIKRPDRMFYLPTYGDGSYYLRDSVEKLPEPLKQRFAEEIHLQPMTPDQIKELIGRLTQSQHMLKNISV